MTERAVLAHNLDAETSILGAVLVDNRALDLLTDRLTGEHFYRPAHRLMWDAMLRLHQQGVAIDFLTLSAELARTAHLDEVGGKAAVAALADGVPRSTNVQYYADLVRAASVQRRVVFLAQHLLEQAQEPDLAAQELLDEAERGLIELSMAATPGGFRSAADLGADLIRVLDGLKDDPSLLRGLRTGLKTLDAYTNGFKPGQVIVLGGRPGEGKSTLAAQIARDVARDGQVVAFFSLEMSGQEQALRAVASEGRVDGHRLQAGQLRGDDETKVLDGLEKFMAMSLFVDDASVVTLMRIRSLCRRLKALHGRLDLVVIDYLQLLQHASRAHNREERVADTSRSLKILARELQVPLLVLSQLKRLEEGTAKRKPKLSDLRESGAIEQDADLGLLIWRPDDKPDLSELILAKHRNGPTGEISLRWVAEQFRLEDVWAA